MVLNKQRSEASVFLATGAYHAGPAQGGLGFFMFLLVVIHFEKSVISRIMRK